MDRRHRLLVLSFLFAALAAAPHLHADWNFLPAGRPYVRTLVTDSAGQRIVLSCQLAGMWRTENGGADWEALNSRFVIQNGYTAKGWTVADADADTLIADFFSYAPVFNPNHFSMDGGLTWQTFADGRVGESGGFFIFPNHTHVWLYSRENVFLRSTDGGANWTSISGMTPFNARFTAPELLNGSVFARENMGEGATATRIFRSNDYGQSWEPIADLSDYRGAMRVDFYDISSASDGSLWVVIETESWEYYTERFLLRSVNSGETWEEIHALPGASWAIEVEEDRDAQGVILVTGDCPGGVARSTDYGQTWANNLNGLPPEQDIAFEIHQNPFGGAIFVTSNTGVYRSDDHGSSWEAIGLPPVGSTGELHVLPEAVFQHSSGEVFGGQWQLESPFTEWADISNPVSVGDTNYYPSQILYKHADTLIAYTVRYFPLDSVNRIRQDFMYRSYDNGVQWVAGQELGISLDQNLIHSLSTPTLTRFAGFAQNQSLYVSRNLGRIWDAYESLPDGWTPQQLAQDANYVYALADSNIWYPNRGLKVFRMPMPSGTDWEPFEMVVTGNRRAHIFPTTAGLYLICDTARFWDGTEWEVLGATPVAGSWHGFWAVTLVENGSMAFVATPGDVRTLYLSEDSGRTWFPRHYSLPFESQAGYFYDLDYDTYRERLWAMTGVGACWLDVAELVVPDRPLQFKPADYTILSVYPNPFNDQARVRFDLLKSERVEITLYDLTGRRVR
ncbi:hypothetical protein KKH27_00525, partial [bacterium]|nr:hypothetical protein [bacterium]MBU1984351.1 hypothetical protein [bacterium]